MVFAGACFFINAIISLSHDIDGHASAVGQSTAVHNAMFDFKRGIQLNVGPDGRVVKKASNSIDEKEEDEKEGGSQKEEGSLFIAGRLAADKKKILQGSKIASLSCEAYGGPSKDLAQEMVYWSDVPSDALYVSPLKHKQKGQRRQYMTFEPDGGGWNNIRMAMETVVGLAIATGRTLVLPPQKKMYLVCLLTEIFDDTVLASL